VRRIVDALGTRCPVPVGLAARAARRLAPGDEIELLADDPLVTVDLPAWCHDHGHVLIELRRERGGYVGLIRVGPEEAPPA
jgi:TusA-related sulfurtransferase